MNNFRKVLLWIYGFAVFLVFPWFLGAIYRQEMSINVFEEAQKDFQRFGTADAALIVLEYLIFYSSITILPYVFLNKFLKEIEGISGKEIYPEISSMGIIIWSWMMFNPLRDFFTYIGSWDWWYVLIFFAITVIVFGILREAMVAWKEKDKRLVPFVTINGIDFIHDFKACNVIAVKWALEKIQKQCFF